MLRAVRSPHHRARFRVGDLGAVLERHPGLVRVLTAADVPGRNGFGIYPTCKDQPVLAADEVRHRGDPVLALVGERAAVAAMRDAELPDRLGASAAGPRHRRGAGAGRAGDPRRSGPTTC